MFSWFRAPQPLRTCEKAWTERTMRRLADRFGLTPLRKADVVFPHEYGAAFDGSEACAHDLFNRVRTAMKVPPGELHLEIVQEEFLRDVARRFPAGRDGTNLVGPDSDARIVYVRSWQLDEPTRLTAAMAHEIAYHLLLRKGFEPSDEPDLELTADLLPVFFGYGLFLANAMNRERTVQTIDPEFWPIGRDGYLPAHTFGYALAIAALFRDEHRPGWSQVLRLDARVPFDQGTRYLATGDSLFHPGTYSATARPARIDELVARLADGTPTFRYDALRELEVRMATGEARLGERELSVVVESLRDRDVDVASAAAQTLSQCRVVSEPIRMELQRAAGSRQKPLRAAAVRALGRLRVCDQAFLDSLEQLLVTRDDDLRAAAVAAVAFLKRSAASLANPLLWSLEQSHIDGHSVTAVAVARALAAVVDDPLEAVRSYYADGDDEMRMLAIEAVRAAQLPPP